MSNSTLIRVSGLAFVALLIASVVMFGDLVGAFGDPDHVFEDYYASAANRRGDILGAYLLTFAGLAFLVFASSLRSAITNGATGTRAIQLAGAFAFLFSALLVTAAAALSVVSLSIAFGEGFGDERTFNSGYAMMPQLGSVLIVVVAPLAAAAFITSVVLGSPRFSSLSRTFSLLCAVALLFGVLYMPLLALPAWVLFMSLGRSRDLTLSRDRVT